MMGDYSAMKFATTSPSMFTDDPQQRSTTCLKCRASHVVCTGPNGDGPCRRCERRGWDCVFAAPNKRGRKPRESPSSTPESPARAPRRAGKKQGDSDEPAGQQQYFDSYAHQVMHQMMFQQRPDRTPPQEKTFDDFSDSGNSDNDGTEEWESPRENREYFNHSIAMGLPYLGGSANIAVHNHTASLPSEGVLSRNNSLGTAGSGNHAALTYNNLAIHHHELPSQAFTTMNPRNGAITPPFRNQPYHTSAAAAAVSAAQSITQQLAIVSQMLSAHALANSNSAFAALDSSAVSPSLTSVSSSSSSIGSIGSIGSSSSSNNSNNNNSSCSNPNHSHNSENHENSIAIPTSGMRYQIPNEILAAMQAVPVKSSERSHTPLNNVLPVNIIPVPKINPAVAAPPPQPLRASVNVSVFEFHKLQSNGEPKHAGAEFDPIELQFNPTEFAAVDDPLGADSESIIETFFDPAVLS